MTISNLINKKIILAIKQYTTIIYKIREKIKTFQMFKI